MEAIRYIGIGEDILSNIEIDLYKLLSEIKRIKNLDKEYLDILFLNSTLDIFIEDTIFDIIETLKKIK